MKDKPQSGRKICSYTSDKGLIYVIYNFKKSTNSLKTQAKDFIFCVERLLVKDMKNIENG